MGVPNTTGNQKVLAIRINFPDHRSTHSFNAVTNKLQAVKRNFDRYSYGKYNLIVTVTPRVYTMPHNAGWYKTAGSLAAAAFLSLASSRASCLACLELMASLPFEFSRSSRYSTSLS